MFSGTENTILNLYGIIHAAAKSITILESSFWSEGFKIIKESVENYKLEFDTHMHSSFSVLCEYGDTNCDKAKKSIATILNC